jgi:hypothetical protein
MGFSAWSHEADGDVEEDLFGLAAAAKEGSQYEAEQSLGQPLKAFGQAQRLLVGAWGWSYWDPSSVS